jgi:hypothetical protein
VIEIRAKAAKTGQRRLIPIQDSLRSFLAAHAEERAGLVIQGVKIALRLSGLCRAPVARELNVFKPTKAVASG